MSLLESVLAPMTLQELRVYYDDSKCLVLEGEEGKFKNLISPQDIENRLNDGCNANSFAQTIKDGGRRANTETSCVWSPGSLCKTQFVKDITEGQSFMMANSSQINRKIAQLVDEIESFFEEDNVHADVHLYCSINSQGNSYNAHRDVPQHKILLQAYGATSWQIFSPRKEIPAYLTAIPAEEEKQWLEVASEFTLKEGGMLYMPPGTFHRVVSVAGPRISISIPFYSMSEARKMDRSFIPFATLFQQ